MASCANLFVCVSIAIIAACVPPQNQSGGYPAQGHGGEPGAAGPRAVSINGAQLDPRQAQTLAQLEATYATTLPDGAYWYDPISGAFGAWGQPAGALLAAGLDLGPPLPADASSGSAGVYINGRELQPGEAAFLSALVQVQLQQGRYFVDAQGNAGVEGGPVLVNLITAAQARARNSGQGAGGQGASGQGGDVFISSGFGSNQSWFSSSNGCRAFMTSSGQSVMSGNCK